MTSDQDWTPSWAAERFLSHPLLRATVPHFFRTNPCSILDAAAVTGKISQGWHPNFLPGSSHGADAASVVNYMQRNFPGLTTARSHAFSESTYAWAQLANAGIIADSQTATMYQAEIHPLRLHNGIIRFPIFFEDDVFFTQYPDDLNLAPVMQTLFTPGLKILNFHATFAAANMPSRMHYDAVKALIFANPHSIGSSQSNDVVWKGRGTLQVFEEVVQRITNAGYSFTAFPDLVTRTIKFIEQHCDRFPRLNAR